MDAKQPAPLKRGVSSTRKGSIMQALSEDLLIPMDSPIFDGIEPEPKGKAVWKYCAQCRNSHYFVKQGSVWQCPNCHATTRTC